jgi:hypothetical protein
MEQDQDQNQNQNQNQNQDEEIDNDIDDILEDDDFHMAVLPIPNNNSLLNPIVKYKNNKVIPYSQVKSIKLMTEYQDWHTFEKNCKSFIFKIQVKTYLSNEYLNERKIISMMNIPIYKFSFFNKEDLRSGSLDITDMPHFRNLLADLTIQMMIDEHFKMYNTFLLKKSNERFYVRIKTNYFDYKGRRYNRFEDTQINTVLDEILSNKKNLVNLYFDSIMIYKLTTNQLFVSIKLHNMYVHEQITNVNNKNRNKNNKLYSLDLIKKEHIFKPIMNRQEKLKTITM